MIAQAEEFPANQLATPSETFGMNEILLTVLIPVYNEAATIETLLSRVLSAPYRKQVIVIDDGSTDGTAALIEKWLTHTQILLLRHLHNRGKGTAIRTGLAAAKGRFTLIQDADLEYDPADYPRLIEPLRRGEPSVVYGSRYLSDSPRNGSGPLWCRGGVALLNASVRLLYGVHLTDEATCFKAFPTELLRDLDLCCRRFEFCPKSPPRFAAWARPFSKSPFTTGPAPSPRARRFVGRMVCKLLPPYGNGVAGGPLPSRTGLRE